MSERARLRLVILRVLMLSLFLSLIARLFYLQVAHQDEIVEAAAKLKQRPITTAPIRGQILDAHGRPLAANRSQLVVFVDRAELNASGRTADTLLRLSKLLKEPYADIVNRVTPCGTGNTRQGCWLGHAFAPVPVSVGTDEAIAQRIVERLEDYPGISVAPMPVRHYDAPAKANAAQILGYLQPITDEELKSEEYKGYDNRQLVGRSGLERQYESVLAGKPGVQLVDVDARNQIEAVISETAPVPGDNLVLSVDAQVQAVTERALKKAVENDLADDGFPDAKTGAAVVLDAKTGRIVSMASYPTYDPSVWIGGIEPKEFARLNSKNNKSLLNLAVSDAFAPGSTFKLVTTIAAMKEGLTSFGGSTYNCTGHEIIGNARFQNYEGRHLGPLTLHEVIVESCDTTYYRWAEYEWLRNEAALRNGRPAQETQVAVARNFGFGSPTGVDLPREYGGLIQDRELKKKQWEEGLREFNCKQAKNPAQSAYQRAVAKDACDDGWKFRLGDQVNFSIGQGTVSTTPLQMALAYGALINGGKVWSPRLAWGVLGADGKVKSTIKPEVRQQLDVSAQTLRDMQDAMCDVPTEGTAKGAFTGFDFSAVKVCGKTGTAQTTKTRDDTSWFASFGGPPGQESRYVVLVVVPDGGNGGETAGPAVREIWEGMYGLNGKSPITLAKKLPAFTETGELATPAPRSTKTAAPSATTTGSPASTPAGESTAEADTTAQPAVAPTQPVATQPVVTQPVTPTQPAATQSATPAPPTRAPAAAAALAFLLLGPVTQRARRRRRST